MFKTSTARTINTMVKDLLRGDQIANRANKVMVVSVYMEAAKDSVSEAGCQRKSVHLMYHTSSNYVLVGTQESDSRLFDHTTWKLAAWHDSCWRDAADSLLTKSYFEMCRAVDPNAAPVSLYTNATIEHIQLREVLKVERDDTNRKIHLTFPALKAA